MLKIDNNIPLVETRGRPPSEEHLNILSMPFNPESPASFISSKSRETLYQVARTLKTKVRILAEGPGKWRVWKLSEAGKYERRNKRKKVKNNGQVDSES
jgi:hypothetical protein